MRNKKIVSEKRAGWAGIPVALVCLVVFMMLGNLALAADWPVYMHDNQGSGVTTEQLNVNDLSEIWVYTPVGDIQNAWGANAPYDAYRSATAYMYPDRDWDYCHYVTVVGGSVFLGSSVDDSAICLNASDGSETWSYTTGGPVRLPPAYSGGKVYFGSDDGNGYCVDATTGAFVWKYKPSSDNRLIANHGKLISAWPVRTGVIVDSGDAYFGASLAVWRGSYLCSVDADTGTPNYNQSHSGKMLQGAMLASSTLLYCTQGKRGPNMFNMSNGTSAGSISSNGCFALITEDNYYGYLNTLSNQDLKEYDISSGHSESIAHTDSLQMVVSGSYAYLTTVGGQLEKRQRSNNSLAWTVPCDSNYQLILATDTLFAGGVNVVRAYQISDGAETWSKPVDGRAYGLAAANNCLYVSTDTGKIHAFEGTPDTDPPTPDPMTWASVPAASGDSSITMTASTATDPSGVEYYFTCTAGGGNDSNWQDDTLYEDTGLTPATQYTYTVTARDKSSNQNATAASTAESATTDTPDTDPPTPDPMTWATLPNATGSTTIAMLATTASDLSGVEYYFTCTAGGGNDSDWQDNTDYEDSGLTPNTQYTYTVVARDKSSNQNATAASTAESATTEDAPPITVNLEGYWPFDGDALDDSGNGHNGTPVNGPGYITGKLGQAIELIGPSDQYLTAASPTSFAPPWSVSAWINKQGPPQASNASGLLDGGTGADWTCIRAEQYGSGSPPKVGLTKYNDPDSHNHYWDYSLPIGSWAHLVFVGTATGTELYVDGVSQGELTGPGDSMLVWIDWIGRTQTYGCPMDAYLDDLGVWSRALTTTEIDYLYNGGAGNPISGGGGPDTDPPTPNPATFASAPAAVSDMEITMTATTGSDASGPVEYFFDETSGNPGADDSGWTTDPVYNDTDLDPDTQYTYTVQMRDSIPNTGTASAPENATTDPAGGLDFLDDFESGNLTAGGWTVTGTSSASGQAAYTGVYGAKIPGVSSIEKALSTVGYTTIHVKYYRKTNSFDSGEYLYAEWHDGTDWHELEATQVSDWGTGQDWICGTGADNNANFKVRFRTNASKTNEYGSVDVVNITGTGGGGGPDTDPPTPDPMTWATLPYATGSNSIAMLADTASDPSGVEYYFTCTAGGGNDSNWQDNTDYEDTGLTPETQYTYTVVARDKSANQNTTAASTAESATTDPEDTTAPTPDPMTWATVPYATGSTSIAMLANTASDPSGVEYYFTCTAGGGNDSNWQDNTDYEDTGLTPETQYTYTVIARDKSSNQNTTAASTAESATTDAGGPPGQASNPSPSDGEQNVNQTANLTWTAGAGAISHDVYFGTSSPPPFIQNQPSTLYDPPGKMDKKTWHYWRIDEVNGSGTTTGVEWSFKTK